MQVVLLETGRLTIPGKGIALYTAVSGKRKVNLKADSISSCFGIFVFSVLQEPLRLIEHQPVKS